MLSKPGREKEKKRENFTWLKLNCYYKEIITKSLIT